MAAPITPISPRPFVGQSVTLPAGVVVEADIAPFTNTKEVIILNRSETDHALVQVADLTGGLPAPASVTAANSTVIPAGCAITLAVGSEGNRQPLADNAFWGANPGSKLGIVYKAEAAGGFDLNITYIQNRGYPEGV